MRMARRSLKTANHMRNIHNDIEIIDFKQPDESEKNLYVSNIVVHLSDEDASAKLVHEELHKAFSRFGLLHRVFPVICRNRPPNAGINSPKSVMAHSGDANTSSSSCEPCVNVYAFVSFYSMQCAKKAKRRLHLSRIVGSAPCKIQYSQGKKTDGRSTQILFPSECYSVANFYLGMDGWSTCIKTWKRSDPLPSKSVISCGQSNSQMTCGFVCVLELTIIRHGLTINGVGSVQEQIGGDVRSKGEMFTKCRKKAFREATRDAFSKLLLVVLSNGKVHMEIDPTVANQMLAGDCLLEPDLLKVNDLLGEPSTESNDEEDGEVEGQGDTMMDSKIIRVLTELQNMDGW